MPTARDTLRRVLIRDQSDRDAIAQELIRYRDEHGQGWADIIDMLPMYPDARHQVVRLLAGDRSGLGCMVTPGDCRVGNGGGPVHSPPSSFQRRRQI
jgi:hypothetical protein